MRVTADEVLECGKQLDGRKISTLAMKIPFTVEWQEDMLIFTPRSGKRRRFRRKAIDKTLETFNKTNSWKTSDYTSRHASYTLAVVARCVGHDATSRAKSAVSK